ncbi:chitin binding Peritrophin-A domain protein, partial [Oesophagostomum dentatum]
EDKGGAPAAAPAEVSPKSVSSTYCALRKDGSYSDGCTAEYITCDKGVATPMKCPQNLVFNAKKGYCDYPESCSSDSSQSQAAQAPQTTKSEPTVSCAGRPNGYHAEGCSSNFVLCTDGVATPMKCPDKLVFNKAKGYCDYPEECQSSQPVKVDTVAHSKAAESLIPALDCTGRRDGYHSNGCSPDFVFCNGGTTTAMKCPDNLVFNMQRQQCDYPENCALETKEMTTRAPVLKSPTEASVLLSV